MANENKPISGYPVETTITANSKVLGINDAGKARLFTLASLRTNNIGNFKTTDAAPPTPLLNQNYTLIGSAMGNTPSGTYTNLLMAASTPLVIPAAASGHAILNAHAVWNGTFWVPVWQDIVIPAQDLSGYVAKTAKTDYLLTLVASTPNLYIPANVQMNKYVNASNGVITSLTNPIVSDFIAVDPTKKYSISSDISLGLTTYKNLTFLNSAKTTVLGFSSRSGVTGLPVNTNCDVSYNNSNGFDINAMPAGTAYVVFPLRGNDTSTTWSTANIAMRIYGATSDATSSIVTADNLTGYLSTNLGHPVLSSFTFNEGFLYNASGGSVGNLISSATWLCTSVVPVVPGSKMYYKGVVGGGNFYIMFFNNAAASNATYVSQIRPNLAADPLRISEVVIPAGCTYVAFNLGTNTTYTFAQMEALFKFSESPSFSNKSLLTNYTINKKDLVNDVQLILNVGGTSIDWQDGKAYTTGPQAGQVAVGWQTLLRRKIAFTGYNNLAMSGFALSAASVGDSTFCWIRQRGTFPVGDVFVLNHGTNDFGLSRELGTTADYTGNTGDTTFYGALRIFVDYCYTTNINYQIVLITPLQRTHGPDVNTANGLGYYLYQYADAVKWVGAKESLPVVDLFNYSGLNTHNLANYTIDGLHPIDPGYVVMERHITPEIAKIQQ